MPDEDTGKNENGNDDAIAKLTDIVGKLAESMESISTAVTSMGEDIEEIRSSSTSLDDDDSDKEVDKKDPIRQDFDLETLGRKEFFDRILQETTKIVKEAVSPLATTVQDDKDSRSRQGLAVKFRQTEKAHKDFVDWKPEMASLIKKNPYLEPEELYTLARAQNQEKAKELDEKYTDPKDKEAKPEGPSFGGLTPTSGMKDTEESMDGKKAAEVAWERTMGTAEAAGEETK